MAYNKKERKTNQCSLNTVQPSMFRRETSAMSRSVACGGNSPRAKIERNKSGVMVIFRRGVVWRRLCSCVTIPALPFPQRCTLSDSVRAAVSLSAGFLMASGVRISFRSSCVNELNAQSSTSEMAKQMSPREKHVKKILFASAFVGDVPQLKRFILRKGKGYERKPRVTNRWSSRNTRHRRAMSGSRLSSRRSATFADKNTDEIAKQRKRP